MAYIQRVALPQTSAGDSRALLPIATLGIAGALGMSLLLGAQVSLLVFFGTAAVFAFVVWPRIGLHAALVLAIVGDLRISGDPNNPTFARMFTSMGGLSLTPLELVLLLTLLGLIIRLLFDDSLHFQPGELALPVAALTLAVLLGAAWGILHDANMTALRAETRGFFYLPILYLLVVSLMKTRAQITQFAWVFIIASNIMALDCAYRYFTYIRGGYRLTAAYDQAFAHENALYCAAAIMVLLPRIVFAKNVFHEWKSLALMVAPLVALVVMGRRAGIVAFDAGLLLLGVVLLKYNIKLFLVAVPIGILLLGTLLAATWDQPGGSGQFARSFRTVIGQESSNRDAASDQYRVDEETNVHLNIADNPVMGLGFGRPYTFYVAMADLSFWPLWPYVAHNTVLWVWMKAGMLGFATLLALFAVAMMRSIQVMAALTGDALRPLAVSLGAIVLMMLLYSWVDVGLVSARALVLFGVTLGCIVALGRVSVPGTIAERRA
jgi:O-antigen ligase